MPAGIIVRDAANNVVVDNSTFLGRHIGSVVIGFGTGTITDDRFLLGIPWAVPLLEGPSLINANSTISGHVDIMQYLTSPTVNFSGNTLIWQRAPSGQPSWWGTPTCTLLYGIS